MKRILFDANKRLRNGWWMLIFIALLALTRPIYRPIKEALAQLGIDSLLLEALPVLLVLAVTWACQRLRGQSLAEVGLRLSGRWARQAWLGVMLGATTLALAVGMMWATGGLQVELSASRSLSALLAGTYFFACVALFEELLFRGFLFQRLVAGSGAWVAQSVFALVFAIGHWDNPGMDGVTQVVATIELALAACVLGLAYLRTGSLALPIGIHFGWNWLQGSVFGMGVSGFTHEGWLRPVLLDVPTWHNGGSFGVEASVFAVAVDLMLLCILWRWRGINSHTQTVHVTAVHLQPQPKVG